MNNRNYYFKIESKKSTAFDMKSEHSHTYNEIYYLKSGERYYFIDDRIYRIDQGDIVFIPQNVLHRTTTASNQEHERTVIYFQSDFLQDIVPKFPDHCIMNCFNRNSKVIRLRLVEQNIIENIIANLVADYNNPDSNSSLYQKALLIELLVYISRIEPQEDITHFQSLNPIHDKIHKIVRYIHSNYSSKISLPQLAERFYLSQYYLSRMFKQVTGLTLIEYINTIRIREAQTLLQTTNKSIAEIAGMVGYENQTYFGRMFKRITYVTPRAYRNSHRSDN